MESLQITPELQETIEIVKLFISASLPITVVLIGIWINKNLQKYGNTLQRKSSWLSSWADSFLKSTEEFNKNSSEFLHLFIAQHLKKQNAVVEQEQYEDTKFRKEIFVISLELHRIDSRLRIFCGFALNEGESLNHATRSFLSQISKWSYNNGGDIDVFREKVMEFNRLARKVHAELLDLE